MNTYYFKFLLLLVVLFQICFNRNLVEDEVTLNKRLAWNKSKENLSTEGKISFEYDKNEGFYCKANKDIAENEFIFNIPSQYVICGCKFLLKLNYFLLNLKLKKF